VTTVCAIFIMIGFKTLASLLRIDLEMIDPFKISLDIRDRGWVSEADSVASPLGDTPPP
jgi:hypothetical protein